MCAHSFIHSAYISQVIVLEDAMKGVSPNTTSAALESMAKEGATVVHGSPTDVLAKLCGWPDETRTAYTGQNTEGEL